MTRKRTPVGVGARLQQARQRRGISLREVADSTKISVSILRALEGDDISWLPGGVLSRGFVRAFASAVGLDPEATVAEFVAQFPLTSVKDGYPAAERIEESVPAETRPAQTQIKIYRSKLVTPLRAVAAALVLAVLGAYAALERWAELPAVQGPVGRATAYAGLPDVRVLLDGLGGRARGSDDRAVDTGRSRDPSAGSTGVHLAGPVSARAAPTAAPAPSGGGSPPSLSASSTPAVDFTPDPPPPNAESPPDPARRETADARTRAGGRLVVVLSVTRPSWLIATVDGTRAVNRMLQVGEEETLEGRDLVLTAGDAGAVVMTLNGIAAKSLGRTGEAVTARLDRTNVGDYLRRDRRSQSETVQAR